MRNSTNVENVKKKKKKTFVRDNSAFCLMGYFIRPEKTKKRKKLLTERTRLMTVPSSVSNISGTAFISATSAVRSHGHRRRY